MDESKRGRTDNHPDRIRLASLHDAFRRPITLWRMNSAALDNQATCSVTGVDGGYDVLVAFAKGVVVGERFAEVTGALRHSMEIAGRLGTLGWIEADLPD